MTSTVPRTAPEYTHQKICVSHSLTMNITSSTCCTSWRCSCHNRSPTCACRTGWLLHRHRHRLLHHLLINGHSFFNILNNRCLGDLNSASDWHIVSSCCLGTRHTDLEIMWNS